MTTYRLVYTSRAKADIAEATDYIAESAPETAERWFQGLVEHLSLLQHNAPVHGLAPEHKFVESEIRQTLYRTKSRRANRILYTIRDDTVYIVSLRRPGQRRLNKGESRELLDDME